MQRMQWMEIKTNETVQETDENREKIRELWQRQSKLVWHVTG